MRLFRFRRGEREFPGLLMGDGRHLDLSSFGEDLDEKFFASNGLSRLEKFATDRFASLPEIAPSFAPAVSRPSKIVCVGLNYAEHADETGAKRPSEPVLFMKATSALCGPSDDVEIPRGAEKLDYEVELAVIIGSRAKYVDEQDALSVVAGYTLLIDYSERAFQKERGGQWTKGKSADTFAPCGPYFVSKDEIPDPQNLSLWLKVNGEFRQQSHTSKMIFPVRHLVSYISQFMTLLPGDIISTGTPSGVALGMDPPRYLRAGDIVEAGIDGIGTLQQRIVAPTA